MRFAGIAVFVMASLAGQTTVDLRSQSKNVDFSGFNSTRPAKTGSSLPSTCSVGELFFRTGVPAGSNWYGCTDSNQWTLEGSGSGGATSSLQLSDCRVSVGGATLTVEPCQVALGADVFSTTSNAVATLGGSAVSGSAYVYWSDMGRLTVDHNTAATLTCNQACDVGSTGGIPSTAIPIAVVTFASGQFSSPVVDRRSIYSTKNTSCGDGLVCVTDGSTGGLNVAIDGTVLDQATLAPSVRGAWASRPACTAALTGQSFYPTDGRGLVSQCDGVAWADYYLLLPIVRPPGAANFTVINGGTLSDTAGTVTFVKTTSGAGAALLPIPDPNATWDAQLAFSATAWSNTHECGLAVTNGVTASASTLRSMVISAGTSGNSTFLARSYNPLNGTLADDGLAAGAAVRMSPLIWMRVTRTSSNTLGYYIGEGGTWTLVKTIAFGSQPTHYGVQCDPRGTDPVTMRVWSLSIQ